MNSYCANIIYEKENYNQLSANFQPLHSLSLKTRNYASIQPSDSRGIMTVSKFVVKEDLYGKNSNAHFQRFNFLLGTASNARVISFSF